MVIYFVCALSLGIEGGYAWPALGFENLNSGTSITVCVNRHWTIADLTLAAGTTLFTGDNSSYTLSPIRLRLGLSRTDWLFSPVVEWGAGYLTRSMHGAHESSYIADYALGLIMNFHRERVRVYPKIYYEGVTDFKEHGGFIHTALGIDYEL